MGSSDSPRLTIGALDLEALAGFVDQHDSPGAYVDPATGEWRPAFDDLFDSQDDEDDEVGEDWIPIGGEGSHAAYRDMETFAAAVADPTVRGRLLECLQGRGAFRRFKDAMWRGPEEVGRAWSAFHDARAELRVLDWAEQHGLVDDAEIAAARVARGRAIADLLARVGQRRRPTKAVDLAEKLGAFTDHWSPKVVARLNDYEVKLAKLHGEFVWHTHEDTDELFLVLDGSLTIQLRDLDVELGPGQLFVVPAGVEHCPVAKGEVSVLLIEPEGVINTGDAGGPRTASYDDGLLDPPMQA